MAEYGEENIRKGRKVVTAELAKEAEIIKAQRSAIIPTIGFSKLYEALQDQETIENIKKRGIVVIRNVFTKEQALAWKSTLDAYLAENKDRIGNMDPFHYAEMKCESSIGYPSSDPWNFRSYYSPVQNEVRSSPQSRQVQHSVNKLWHGYWSDEALPLPLIYANSLRHCRPGEIIDSILPHIDTGSLDR